MRTARTIFGLIVPVSLLATGCALPICEEIPGLCGSDASGEATADDAGEVTETGSSGGSAEAGSDGGAPLFCGGIAGFPCPDGLECIDDPDDDCDPRLGGADCGGICVERTTCDLVIDAFRRETRSIRSCEADAECGQVLTGTSCGCTRNWVARLDADLTTWSALFEEALANQCDLGGSTCDCPVADGFACVDQVCTWNYVTDVRR